MTNRERFEAWMRERQGYPYAAQFANLMWAAWQAAERQALERAIRATAQAKTTSHACDAIRALIEGASSDKEGS